MPPNRDSDLDARSEPELAFKHHHATSLKTLPPRVFECALLFDHLALEDHGPAPTLSVNDPSTDEPWLNPVDDLLKKNASLWTMYIRNEFCRKMAVSKIPIDPQFRAYAIQDYVFLWEYVRQVAVRTVAAPTIPELAEHPKEIYKAYGCAIDWKKTCIDHLNIEESDIEGAKAVKPVKDYLDWMMELGQEGTWLDLHVLILPCLQGYYDIARLIEEEVQEPLNRKFYEYWVKPNIKDTSAKRLREFFGKNISWYYQPDNLRRSAYIFSKTIVLEMRILAYFLGLPLPDLPDRVQNLEVCDTRSETDDRRPR
ncbi:hypothetical protein M407DRAFT_25228 [Tulasnella calospora MUT 4182]|uniref:Thiaminase-2/PQQC domain-containing protein n=1 Tax=Tulasnella calospora MUT 4182 TaxID=1051891 RepID=A0A0C3QHX0_9AGAM|nr:hypothetical protein M407DRAFT_25228 [Tulasnella calospora MUT 4182]